MQPLSVIMPRKKVHFSAGPEQVGKSVLPIELQMEACSAPASICCSPLAKQTYSKDLVNPSFDSDSLDRFLLQAQVVQNPRKLKDNGSIASTAASDDDQSCTESDAGSVSDLWASNHFPPAWSRESSR
jgi:hypothetical protein